MVESIATSEAYQDFDKKNNRFINMLADNVLLTTLLFSFCRTETSGGRGWKTSGNA